MKKFTPQIFIFLVIGYILFLIYPAITGQLSGTFKSHMIPEEYEKLESFLISQTTFSRTLWLPTNQRFGFFSMTHPAVSGEDVLHVSSISGVLEKLRDPEAQILLSEMGVRYVIVPYDSEKEIFIKDRKYDNTSYKKTVDEVSRIPWLKKVNGFGKIIVFEIANSKDHFWVENSQGNITFSQKNPAFYVVTVKNVQKGQRLIFSEAFDKKWMLHMGNKMISSEEYDGYFNQFTLPKDGDYSLAIIYEPQKWVMHGLWISAIFAIFVTILFLILTIKFKKIIVH